MSANSDQNDEKVPLLERTELPSIPKDAKRDLALLEREFIEAEVRSMRQAVPIMRPLYSRRNQLVSSKLQQADFWPRVFANSPAEVDSYVRPSDAEIIGSCLKNLTVERFSVNDNGEGEPRNVRFVFEFDNGPENKWFEDSKIVKEFHWRKIVTRSPSGKRNVWEGLVSDPVRINWKKDQDPTNGLLDAACNLADAEKAALKKEGKAKLTGEERLKLPEYEKLVHEVAKVEEEVGNDGEGDDEEGESSPAGLSFFAWFGYRGKDITAEESTAATKEDNDRWEKIAKGEKLDDEKEDDEDEDEDEDEDDDQDSDNLTYAEIFPDGEELAVSVSDDLWPNALKYYVQSYDVMSDGDLDFDMDDDDEDEDDDEAEGENGAEDDDETERPRKKVKT